MWRSCHRMTACPVLRPPTLLMGTCIPRTAPEDLVPEEPHLEVEEEWFLGEAWAPWVLPHLMGLRCTSSEESHHPIWGVETSLEGSPPTTLATLGHPLGGSSRVTGAVVLCLVVGRMTLWFHHPS